MSHVCRHCGVTFRWQPEVVVAADSEAGPFCCHGCSGAYQLIHSAGLDEFYRRTNRMPPTVAALDRQAFFRDADLLAHVIPEGDHCRLDILIGGIRCPSCVWLLERMLLHQMGVAAVSITYTGGIASLTFDPDRVLPSALFTLIARLGYTPRPYTPALADNEAIQERNDLLIRLGTGLFLGMQLMAFSFALYAGYFQGMGTAIKNWLQFFSFLVTTPVVFYCGWPFFRAAWHSVLTRTPGMDLLIAVGAGSAWGYSSYAALIGGETYFESAAVIVTFILVGRLFELSVRRTALSGVQALYTAVPQRAVLAEDGSEIPLEQVRPGDLLLVRQGERFPVDAVIVAGETEIDQALVTGESIPVAARPGDEVRAGCITTAATITAKALRPVGQSFVMRVLALVHMAQAEKPAIQRLADRTAAWFVPAVLLLATITFLVLISVKGDGVGAALLTALSVVLIACPCALGLAVPTAVLAACSRAAVRGVILRGGAVIERLAAIDTVLLDKTGTLTAGRPTVLQWGVVGECPAERMLQAAVTLERHAAHPLARAIETCAMEQGIVPLECRDFSVVPGRGVSGLLPDGTRVECGSRLFLVEQGVNMDALASGLSSEAPQVFVALNSTLAGYLTISDAVRPGAARLVHYFVRYGAEIRLVSGDSAESVERICREVGVGQGVAGMTPAQKMAMISELHGQRRRVLMVGDGVNDAPALAAADVSCTLSGSSDLALEHADIIVTAADLSSLAEAHALAGSAMRVIKQNLVWACIYNVIGIPLAMIGMLTPVYAAIAMTASSLMVSLNSLRLMRR